MTTAMGLAAIAPFLAYAAPELQLKNDPQAPTEQAPVPPEDDAPPLPMKEAPPQHYKEEPRRDELPPVKMADPPMMEAMPVKANDTWNYRTDIHVSKDGTTIQLVGQITEGVSLRLNDALALNPNAKTLVLTSEGGLLVEGAALAHIVRRRGLNTHVEFLCASACTFPLLAGKSRSMAPGALIGFHQASPGYAPFVPAGTAQTDEAGNRMMQATYAKASLGQPFVDKALSTPPGDLWYPDTAMLQANSVVTRFARHAEFPISIGEWPTATAFVNELASDPLWVAARDGKSKHYTIALAAGWALAASGKTKSVAVQSARGFLVRRLLSDAPAYSDDLVAEFAKTEKRIWQELGYNNNRDCDLAFNLRYPVAYPYSEVHKKLQLAILKKMIATSANVPLPDNSARSNAQADMMEFWGQMIAERSYSNYNVASNFCRDPLNYYEEMEKLPEAERLKLLRSLMLVQSIGLRA